MPGRDSETPDARRGELLTTEELKALSHPVRRRIVAVLAARGTGRAADLATDLALPANQISFHLRSLAKAGLIEEAPEHARDRRDRVWRPAQRNMRVVDPSVGSDAARLAALGAFMSTETEMLTATVRRILGWLNHYAAGEETEPRAEWMTRSLNLTQTEALDVLERVMTAFQEAESSRNGSEPTDGQERRLWEFTVLAARDDI